MWNLNGTYHITKIKNDDYPTGFPKPQAGLISFIYIEGKRPCEYIYEYRRWALELPEVIPTTDNCNFHLYPKDESNAIGKFYGQLYTGNGSNYIELELTKLYDSIFF